MIHGHDVLYEYVPYVYLCVKLLEQSCLRMLNEFQCVNRKVASHRMLILWLQLPGMFRKLLTQLHLSLDALLLPMQKKFCERSNIYLIYFIQSKVAAVDELLFPHRTSGCAQGGLVRACVIWHNTGSLALTSVPLLWCLSVFQNENLGSAPDVPCKLIFLCVCFFLFGESILDFFS